jgi:hypothetical protein
MTPEPIDPLQSFYNDCHLAPVPDSLTVVPAMLPWWCRLLVPAGGLGFGGLLALVLLTSGSSPTKQEALEATRNFARAKYDFAMNQKPIAPPKEHLHSERKALGGRPWIG